MTSSTALPAAQASGLPPNVVPCVPGFSALANCFLGQHGAEREAAADALRRRHDVGRDAGPFMREQLAGAAHAGLHLVHAEDDAVLVAYRAQIAQELHVGGTHAALALDRLDDDAGGARDRSRCAPRSCC